MTNLAQGVARKDSVIRIPIEYLESEDFGNFAIRNSKYGTYAKEPEYFNFWTALQDKILIPRNYPLFRTLPLVSVVKEFTVGKRVRFPEPKLTFRDYQEDAINAYVTAGEDGIIEAPCGAGKTIIGGGIIHRIGYKAAVLVSTKQLLFQWVDRIESLFGITPGVYYGDKKTDGDIVVFSIQSIYDKQLDPEYGKEFHLTIFDECHEAGAIDWNRSLMSFTGPLRLGLSATLDRKDGLDALMYYSLGSVVHSVPRDVLVNAGQVLVPDVLYVSVDFPEDIQLQKRKGNFVVTRYSNDPPLDMANTMTNFALNPLRNEVIVDLIEKCRMNGRKILVVLNRTASIELIGEMLARIGIPYGVLRGGTKDYESAYNAPIILGMIGVVKRGLDIPSLDTAILACPVSDPGLIEQLLGRISRPFKGKKDPMLIDLLDKAHIAFIRMREARKRVYRKLGCHFRNGK